MNLVLSIRGAIFGKRRKVKTKNLLFLSAIFGAMVFSIGCSSANSQSPKAVPKQDSIAVVMLDTSLHNGDIIFHSSTSQQSSAIQLATHSKYSHCGLIFNDAGKWMVYEAVQPVKKTPLKEFVDRGIDHHYIIKRVKDAKYENDSVEALVKAAATKRLGKNYDLYFNWDEDRIYCSELVWKSWNDAAGIELGARRPLKDFDLTSPIVKKKLAERYGDSIPSDVLMISPGDIADSPLLKTVKEQ